VRRLLALSIALIRQVLQQQRASRQQLLHIFFAADAFALQASLVQLLQCCAIKPLQTSKGGSGAQAWWVPCKHTCSCYLHVLRMLRYDSGA
jgi:hypothetical protein